MPIPDAETPQSFRLRWDGVVTAGNALTIISFLGMILVWSLRLEGRVDGAVKDMTILQKRVEMSEARSDRNDANIQAAIQRLDDKITQLLRDGQQRPNNRP